MHTLIHLLLSAFASTEHTIYATEVGLDFDPNDGQAYELDYGYYPYKTYQTIDMVSPILHKVVDSPQCYDGLYTMFTPRGWSVEAPGPMIVDNYGELVWTKNTAGQAYNLVMHKIDGEQYLTYWIGDDRIRGHGQGDWYMVR